MTKEEAPHYIYIAHNGDGSRSLNIMTKRGEMFVEPLTIDKALHWSKSFLIAAMELRKLPKEVTAHAEVVQPSGDGSSDNLPKGDPSPGAVIREG